MKERDIQKLVGGLVFIIFFVKCLKKIIRSPRPQMFANSTFGMPSTRAASIFFMVTFLILVNQLSNKTIIFLFGAAIFCCILKYFLQEHTITQLCVGGCIGILAAYILSY